MIVLLLACHPASTPIRDAPGFLERVTDVWWSLEDAEIEFHLETGGNTWYNIVGFPHAEPSGDLYVGEWLYEGDGKFVIDGYDIQVRVMDADPACYHLSYGGGIKTDIACPYDGELVD
jgi:hypothetical protein